MEDVQRRVLIPIPNTTKPTGVDVVRIIDERASGSLLPPLLRSQFRQLTLFLANDQPGYLRFYWTQNTGSAYQLFREELVTASSLANPNRFATDLTSIPVIGIYWTNGGADQNLWLPSLEANPDAQSIC